MKSIGILGTSSDAGKSWVATAFCAYMKRHGVKVAPFKAQNMSNNSFVTLEGHEIGRAQAVQSEACGLRPIAQMNPVLLKPSGDNSSQLVLLGEAQVDVEAQEYYRDIDKIWSVVRESLDYWKRNCDLLILEGAGSPVELNLMDRDIVNLRPVEYLNGKWILVADIERGGVFAQAIGSWNLLSPEDQSRGLGLIVNKFRGDPTLFSDAEKYFKHHMSLDYLGLLPMRFDLQPESEDGFTLSEGKASDGDTIMAWIRFPRVSNTQDAQPCMMDKGIHVRWVNSARDLEDAEMIVLPGSKNTMADLKWLRESGIAEAILNKYHEGKMIVGICGGYQMLGQRLSDPDGIAGSAGEQAGLGLLPLETQFVAEKEVLSVKAHFADQSWDAYEIHMGRTQCKDDDLKHLLDVTRCGEKAEEGYVNQNVWGSYLHGLFESSTLRESLYKSAGVDSFWVDQEPWCDKQTRLYDAMADCLEEYLDMNEVMRYVGV